MAATCWHGSKRAWSPLSGSAGIGASHLTTAARWPRSMQRFLRLLGNGQREQRSSAGVITSGDFRRRVLVLQCGRLGVLLGTRGAGTVWRVGGGGWHGASPAALLRHPRRGAALRARGGTGAHRPV